jgi:glycosyltransferase involved in cell wall biosynthesis
MERIAREKTFRNQLAQAGLNRAKEFSWEKTAQETLTLFKKLVS